MIEDKTVHHSKAIPPNTNYSGSIKLQKTLANFSPKIPILEFCQTCSLNRIIEDNIIHYLKKTPANTNESILIKVQSLHIRLLLAILGLILAQNAQFFELSQTCDLYKTTGDNFLSHLNVIAPNKNDFSSIKF